jgi:hypothetical protein
MMMLMPTVVMRMTVLGNDIAHRGKWGFKRLGFQAQFVFQRVNMWPG